MRFDDYQDLAQRTSGNNCPETKIANGILGLCGEVGEVAEHIKKYTFHGKEYNLEEVRLEIGDVLWYIAELCSGFGFSMDQIAGDNIRKLEKRWPNGFQKEGENGTE